MRLCNETITVFNCQLDTQADLDVYHGTVIRGVSIYCEIASTVDNTGLKAADKYTIRVPADANFSGKSYVDPVIYQKSDPASTFTLKSGDIIVKGEVDIENPKPKDLQQRYADLITVLGVTDNRRAPNAPHWKVVGK